MVFPEAKCSQESGGLREVEMRVGRLGRVGEAVKLGCPARGVDVLASNVPAEPHARRRFARVGLATAYDDAQLSHRPRGKRGVDEVERCSVYLDPAAERNGLVGYRHCFGHGFLAGDAHVDGLDAGC